MGPKYKKLWKAKCQFPLQSFHQWNPNREHNTFKMNSYEPQHLTKLRGNFINLVTLSTILWNTLQTDVSQ